MDNAVAAYEDVSRALRSTIEVLGEIEEHGQWRVHVRPGDRPAALAALKRLGFTHYIFCGAVDWPDDGRFDILDHVYSIERRQRVTVRCEVPRDQPRLPSAVDVFAGADWHERETWELFGVVFAGHPHLVRLLLPDWFEGFPMRKDYVLPARVEKPWPGESFKPE